MSKAPWHERYTDRFYYLRPGFKGGTEEFHDLCSAYIARGSKILEIGAGPSNPTSRFLATLGELHGVDPDPEVTTNDALQKSSVMNDAKLPVPDGFFDCCVSDYVVEHVKDGPSHLHEVARVLRPGGVYLFRTVNRFHYVALVASMTPYRLHAMIANRARALPKDAHDPYPTVYALNTRRAIARSAARAQLRVERVEWLEKEPYYGKFSRIAFFTMMFYERIVNSFGVFAPLRSNMLVVLRKSRG